MGPRRASSLFSERSRPKSHPELDWQFDEDIQDNKSLMKKAKKASQIAKELSDLVVYLQAVKFRGNHILYSKLYLDIMY
ncbi:1-phosphatidylinositol 4 [Mactra antiquata]